MICWRPNWGRPYTSRHPPPNLSFRDFLFLDTETTGLAGARFIAFMVGVAPREGRWSSANISCDFGDRTGVLLLDELLAEKSGLVTV
ncbi:MAG: hypothetical protein H6667_22120 [Ardenticatenaceae bacterium]|nr:hypothetical protein [Ardenticatenaceae bacterium]